MPRAWLVRDDVRRDRHEGKRGVVLRNRPNRRMTAGLARVRSSRETVVLSLLVRTYATFRVRNACARQRGSEYSGFKCIPVLFPTSGSRFRRHRVHCKEQSATPSPAPAPPSPALRSSTPESAGILLWVRDLVISAVAAALIILFLYQPVRVEGTSMLPRLEDSDRLFINKFVYHVSAIDRGDVVVFHYPRDPEKSYIKRVIVIARRQPPRRSRPRVRKRQAPQRTIRSVRISR